MPAHTNTRTSNEMKAMERPCNRGDLDGWGFLAAVAGDAEWPPQVRAQAAVYAQEAAKPHDATFYGDRVRWSLRQIMDDAGLPLPVRTAAAAELLGEEESDRNLERYLIRR
jgi:hypothetical protein